MIDYVFSGNQYIRVRRGEAGSGCVDPGYPTSDFLSPDSFRRKEKILQRRLISPVGTGEGISRLLCKNADMLGRIKTEKTRKRDKI